MCLIEEAKETASTLEKAVADKVGIDALELREIAESAVLDYLDLDKYLLWIKRESEEKEALKEFGKTLSKK